MSRDDRRAGRRPCVPEPRLGGRVRLLEERCARGVATPAEQLTVLALREQPDDGDEAAVLAWQPTERVNQRP